MFSLSPLTNQKAVSNLESSIKITSETLDGSWVILHFNSTACSHPLLNRSKGAFEELYVLMVWIFPFSGECVMRMHVKYYKRTLLSVCKCCYAYVLILCTLINIKLDKITSDFIKILL